ncbi:MAG: two-component regulator propeller domain-containing protein [Bacteroidales bacterium]|nr:two-component regulator propeller domain-containing protein [Bacteroidales bacterium]
MVFRTILVFSLFACLSRLKAQEVSFRHLAVEDGLSQNTINCIYQDHYGFMWFGTQDGLNCYDGLEFTTYRSVPEDSGTLSHNWIWDITEDESQNLWIATWNGLTKYDRSQRSFQRFLPDSSDNNSISGTRPASLARDRRGQIWIGIWGGGLNVLDPATGVFTRYRNTEDPVLNYPGDFVRKLYIDREGTVWIGTWNGLWRCRVDEDSSMNFESFIYDPEDSTSVSSMRITSFCEDREGNMWIGTLGGGLNLFNRTENCFRRFQYDPDNRASLSSNEITSIEKLKDGSLWIGTVSKGLNRLNLQDRTFTRFSNDPSDPGSLASDNVYSVFTDRGGVLWVGAGGLNLFNPDLLRFEPTGTMALLKEQVEGLNVNTILEDSQGFFWAGTFGNGLVRLHMETGELSWYRHLRDNHNSISSNIVTDIKEDPEGYIWISTNGAGLNRLDPLTGNWRHFRERKEVPETTGLDYISGIVVDKTGNLWIASSDEGLICYDPESDRYRRFRNESGNPSSLSGNYLLRIFLDSQGDIWLGTWGAGLNHFDPEKGTFIRYMSDVSDPHTIPGNIVHSIFEQKLDTARILWVGTANGLASFNPGYPEAGFTSSGVNTVLPSRSVYGMLTDSKGKQWISSNAGISRYDPRDGSFMHYTHRNGLPGSEYNAGAFLKLRSGMLAFGGIGGLLVFHPDSVYESSFEPTVALTSFSVFNERLFEAIDLNAIKQIALSYKQNFFSFEFASMDFADPEKNSFMYKMDGIDQEWILSGERNFASYTKIDPGDYLFRVRGTNSDGLWSKQLAQIQVIITPPIWQRWWFRVLLLLAVFMVFVAIHLYRIRRVREIERLRTQIASDLHDDIGSALTRISVHSQQILARKDPERIRKSTEKINQLSRDTISTMSDIVWSIDARNDTLADFLGRMQDLTHSMLSERDISVSFMQKGMDSRRALRVEIRQNLYYIFKEAIHNIARHSGADRVDIRIENSDSLFHMVVSDNGAGFDPGTARAGNGLRNMKMRAGRIGASLEISGSGGCLIELRMKGF